MGEPVGSAIPSLNHSFSIVLEYRSPRTGGRQRTIIALRSFVRITNNTEIGNAFTAKIEVIALRLNENCRMQSAVAIE